MKEACLQVSNLTMAQVISLRDENPREYLRLLDSIQQSNEHLWCGAPAVMTTLVPSILDDNGMLPGLKAILYDQLRNCSQCMRCYHAGVITWRAETDLDDKNASNILRSLLEWDAKRLIPDMRKTVSQYRSANEMAKSNAYPPELREMVRRHGERLLFEMLLDARLTMRLDISSAIADVFAVFNPISEGDKEAIVLLDEDDICLPGIFVLCLHQSAAVRGWARRCVERSADRPLDWRSPGLSSSLDAVLRTCITGILCSRNPAFSSKDDADMGMSNLFDCSRDYLWSQMHILVTRLKSGISLGSIIQENPTFLQTIWNSIGEETQVAVHVILRLMWHFLTVLGGSFWKHEHYIDASTLLDTMKSAYFICDSNDVRLAMLDMCEPLVLSLGGGPNGLYEDILRECLSFLNHICSDRRGSTSDSNYGYSSESNAKFGVQQREREVYATIMLHCYRCCPSILSELYDVRIAVLLEVMFTERDVKAVAVDLLHDVLLTDARNLVRALTSTDIASLAFRASFENTLISSAEKNEQVKASDSSRVSSDDEGKLTGDSDGNLDSSRSSSLLFSRMPLTRTGELFWAQRVWENVRIGRFSRYFESSKHALSMHVMLSEVHGLVGLLDIHDGIVTASTLTDRVKVLLGDSGPHAKSDDELFRASVELAYVTVLDTIEAQLACRHLHDANSEDPWLDLLPCSAGHLMASCRRSVRDATSKLLQWTASRLLRMEDDADGSSGLRRLLGDRTIAEFLLRGTISAVHVLSIYGPRYAFRGYLHMIRWLELMLSMRIPHVDEFLRCDGQEQISCMVEQYLLHWEALRAAHPCLFSELTCRFLKSLPSLWSCLFFADKGSDVVLKRNNLLDAVLGLRLCDDRVVMANWAKLATQIAETYGFNEAHQQIIWDMFEEADPAQYRGEVFRKLSVAFKASCDSSRFDAPKVVRPMHQLSITDIMTSCSKAGPDSTDLLITSAEQSRWAAAKSIQPKSERARLLSLQKRLSGSAEKRGSMRPKRPTKLAALVGRPAPTLTKLTRERHVHKGPSKMEQLVAAYRAQRESEKDSSNAASILDAHDCLQPASTSNKAVVSQRQNPGFNTNAEVCLSPADALAAAKELTRKGRREMKTRELDQLHGKILSFEVASIRRKPVTNIKGILPLTKLRTSEEYVSYWEKLLLEEIRAQIVQSLEEEERAAPRAYETQKERRPWLARTPFEVVNPAEPQKSCKKLLIRYCGEGSMRESGLKGLSSTATCVTKQEDFSAASVQVHDLVRLQVANKGRGHKEGQHSSRDVSVVLGYVSGISFQGPEVNIAVKVKFPSGFSEPGPGRAICLSRLFSLVPHHRQFEALWRVNTLSDIMLRYFLDPKGAWKEYRARCLRDKDQVSDDRMCDPAVSSTFEFFQNELNASQLKVLTECRRLCKLGGNGDGATKGGILLLQGPPGSGKTSTIMALLSVLLAPSLRSRGRKLQSLSTRKVRVDGVVMEVPVAPYRILVCAPSNSAVDEVLLRVMKQGLLVGSGCYATPRIVRVGGGSKYRETQAVSCFETMGKWNISRNDDGSFTKDDHQLQAAISARDCLRSELRGINAEIGDAHCKRELLRQSHEKQLDSGRSLLSQAELVGLTLEFETAEKELTDILTTKHEKKQAVLKQISLADENVKLTEKKCEERFSFRVATLINGSSIVFSTLNSAGHEVLSHMSGAFDAVIIDESAQAIEPDILIPLVGANRRSLSKVPMCIMVGDPMQLPATVLSTDLAVVEALRKSFFERLQSAEWSKTMLLNTQYRMHPVISRFPSIEFYQGRLKNGACVKMERCLQPYHFDSMRRFGPVTFLDTTSCISSRENRSSNGSVSNPGDATIVCKLLVSLFRLYPEQLKCAGQVAVLAPYQSQVGEIRRQLMNQNALSDADIEVNTIDAIQGREKQIVILSTVRGGNATSGIGFVKDKRRMNVALTRAKTSLIVVGNASALENASSHWASYVSLCRSRNCLLDVASVNETFPESLDKPDQSFVPARIPPGAAILDFSETEDVISSDSSVADEEDASSDIDSEIEYNLRIVNMSANLSDPKDSLRRINNARSEQSWKDVGNEDSPVPLARNHGTDEKKVVKQFSHKHETDFKCMEFHSQGMNESDLGGNSQVRSKIQPAIIRGRNLRGSQVSVTRKIPGANKPGAFQSSDMSRNLSSGANASHDDFSSLSNILQQMPNLSSQDQAISKKRLSTIASPQSHASGRQSEITAQLRGRNGSLREPKKNGKDFPLQVPENLRPIARKMADRSSSYSDSERLSRIKKCLETKSTSHNAATVTSLRSVPVLESIQDGHEECMEAMPAGVATFPNVAANIMKPPKRTPLPRSSNTIGIFSLAATAEALDKTVNALRRVQRPVDSSVADNFSYSTSTKSSGTADDVAVTVLRPHDSGRMRPSSSEAMAKSVSKLGDAPRRMQKKRDSSTMSTASLAAKADESDNKGCAHRQVRKPHRSAVKSTSSSTATPQALGVRNDARRGVSTSDDLTVTRPLPTATKVEAFDETGEVLSRIGRPRNPTLARSFSLAATAEALDKTGDALRRVQRPLTISKPKSIRKKW